MDIGEVIDEILKADKTAIPVDLGFGPEGFFDITKSVVVTWGILAAWLLLCLVLTTGGRKSKREALAVLMVVKLRELVKGMLGEGGHRYAEYIITVLLFLGLANMVGLVGLTPPTMDLNVTVGLSVMSIVLVEAAGIRAKGLRGWLGAFKEPIAVVLPMNILEIGIRPLSLCMRLFGNVLGATVIMELIKAVLPLFLPALLSAYFDIFDGFIQAYVFCFLTSLYIAEATEPKEEENPEELAAQKEKEEAEKQKEREEKLRRKAEKEADRFDAREFYRRLMMRPPKKEKEGKAA